jgi:hypothetical protein
MFNEVFRKIVAAVDGNLIHDEGEKRVEFGLSKTVAVVNTETWWR